MYVHGFNYLGLVIWVWWCWSKIWTRLQISLGGRKARRLEGWLVTKKYWQVFYMKYHPSLVIYFSFFSPKTLIRKLKLGLQIGERLLIANHLDPSGTRSSSDEWDSKPLGPIIMNKEQQWSEIANHLDQSLNKRSRKWVRIMFY
jgi:hypothetical protein